MKVKQAIAHARANVSTPHRMGGGWQYLVYRPDCNAWAQSINADWHRVQASRAQALINAARDAMGAPCVQYDGGPWQAYV